MPGIVGLTDLVERYFYSSQWLWIFVIALLYLIVRVNTARKRALVAALAFFFLFVNSFVIGKFTALGENGTFYRHLWAIPTIVIVAIAILDIIKIIPKWYLRIPAVAAIVVGIWFVNSNEYIRLRDLPLSTDGKMVSQDVIDLTEDFEKYKMESGKNMLFVMCDSQTTELRLYSGFLDISSLASLNDSTHYAETEVGGENPDVPHIMSKCCANGIDFVVVSRSEGTKKAFVEYGYEPVFMSDSYYVYHCDGYKGFDQDKNQWGQIAWKAYYDEHRMPELQSTGYSIIKYIYDSNGNKAEERYYGTNDEPCIIPDGYAGKRFEYNKQRERTKETYVDLDGKAINLPAGYASVIRTYSNGLIETTKYVDVNGIAVIKGGRFETRYEYDENKNITRESYYDENGHAMLRVDALYASRTIEYDDSSRIIGEKYYDINNKLTKSASGYAGYIRELDDEGRVIRESYEGEDGNALTIPKGYASLTRKYDQNMNEIFETYYDETGNITTCNLGYASVNYVYNGFGDSIEETFFDIEGNRSLCSKGYAKVKRTYNNRRQLLREEYFDTYDNPINNNKGIAGFERVYDNWELVEEIPFDMFGRLITVDDNK